ncbi:MAG: tRNA 4-thiouridine(8) synthase ThiI [Erysipelotrichales bacterium]|nr:tRNA 4-thiouridine(8) synthase ThiI [Erysipelotrichales bacterium]
MYDRILIRYGDLTLKGNNKKIFLNRIYQTVRNKFAKTSVTIEKTFDRMYIILNDESIEDCLKRLGTVCGLYSFSPAIKVESNLETIISSSIELLKDKIKEIVTFKVETKRANKNFPMTSPEISKAVSKEILKVLGGVLKVDVHNPEKTLRIDVKNEYTYLYLDEVFGLGGFPPGILGKGLLLISGGIDSPVAGFLAMKQGIEIECLHFESTPLTPIESAQKVIDLTAAISKYSLNNRIKLHMINFEKIHQLILKEVPESYMITIMRRIMYKIAALICEKDKISCIVNGESVGQVASQTLESIQVVNEVTNLPVIRPVVTYDKLEIIKIAKNIETFDISIRPFEDCCTVYVPKSPVTRPTLKRCLEIERKTDFSALIEEAVQNYKARYIEKDQGFDLISEGFIVSDIF